MLRRAVAAALALAACNSPRASTPPPSSAEEHLADLISRELTSRFGAPLSAHCDAAHGTCTAALPDGAPLAVRVARDGAGWTWKLDGDFVDTAPIAAYVEGALADRGVAQKTDCGPRVAHLPRGARLRCELSGGGAAFVTLGSDRALELELAIDSTAAAARGEQVTPARAHELEARSHALEHASDDEGDP